MKKLFAMLLVLALMLSAVTVLAEKPESETPLKLQWSQGIGVDTLFESPARDQQSLYPYMVFDTLMYWDGANSEHVPALATEWSNNEDYTEFTLTIREGVKWHDGEEVSAEDVAFTIEYYIANPNSSGARKFQYVEGYDALKNGEAEHLAGMSLEGNVITLKLSKSYPLFLSGIYSTMILPKHLLGGIAWADIDSSDYWKKPVGCGAYCIDQVSFPVYAAAADLNGNGYDDLAVAVFIGRDEETVCRIYPGSQRGFSETYIPIPVKGAVSVTIAQLEGPKAIFCRAGESVEQEVPCPVGAGTQSPEGHSEFPV